MANYPDPNDGEDYKSEYEEGKIDLNAYRQGMGLSKVPDFVERIADSKILGFDENTLFKVYDVLRSYNLSEQVSRDIINQMQNKGILFREMVPRDSTYRALQEVQSSLQETRDGLRSNMQGLGPVARSLIDPSPANDTPEK